MSEVSPDNVVSISSSRKSEMRSNMSSILPVCSPAMVIRITMLGKIGCLPRAIEMLSPRSMSVEESLIAFSMTTLPTVCDTICSTSRMGTPLRINEARVRVNRARQILWAMIPKIGIRIRRESQNHRPGLVLMK